MCMRVVIHTRARAQTTIVNKAVVGVTQFIFKLNNVLRYGGGCSSVFIPYWERDDDDDDDSV